MTQAELVARALARKDIGEAFARLVDLVRDGIRHEVARERVLVAAANAKLPKEWPPESPERPKLEIPDEAATRRAAVAALAASLDGEAEEA